jgi:hypothetical protein
MINEINNLNSSSNILSQRDFSYKTHVWMNTVWPIYGLMLPGLAVVTCLQLSVMFDMICQSQSDAAPQYISYICIEYCGEIVCNI